MKIMPANINKKGFSLVEVILVVLVVGAISALVANLPSSIKLIGNGRHESLAKEIAIKNMEDLRSQLFDNLANGTTQIVDSRLSTLPKGTGSVLIEECPPSICKNSETYVKQITVAVNWFEAGQIRNVQIVTLITKGGLK